MNKASRVGVVYAPECTPRELNELAQRITDIAPLIEIVDEQHVLIPMRGPSRYFGGDHAVAQRILAFSEGRELRIGVADGRLAALIAARYGAPVHIVEQGCSKEFLSGLSVEELHTFTHIAPNTLSLLSRLGLGTLGKVAATNRQLLSDRFGPEGNTLFVLCNGVDLHPPLIEKIPTAYRVEAHYDDALEHMGSVFDSARQLVAPMVEQLEARGLAMCRVVIALTTEHDDTSERVWYHPAGFSGDGLLERLRWQVTSWLEESVGLSAGVQRIAVDVQDTVLVGSEQPRLWGGRSDADRAACMAISRVAGIVGETNVCVPEWRGGRDPGQQYVLVPAAQVDLANIDANMQRITPGALHPKEWSGDVGIHVPCETVSPPEHVEVLSADGIVVGATGRHHFTSEPHSVRRRGKVFRITTWFGPWPVEERWWDPTRQRRMVRMQCTVLPEDHTARKDITGKEEAWLLSLEQKKWFVIGVYS